MAIHEEHALGRFRGDDYSPDHVLTTSDNASFAAVLSRDVSYRERCVLLWDNKLGFQDGTFGNGFCTLSFDGKKLATLSTRPDKTYEVRVNGELKWLLHDREVTDFFWVTNVLLGWRTREPYGVTRIFLHGDDVTGVCDFTTLPGHRVVLHERWEDGYMCNIVNEEGVLSSSQPTEDLNPSRRNACCTRAGVPLVPVEACVLRSDFIELRGSHVCNDTTTRAGYVGIRSKLLAWPFVWLAIFLGSFLQKIMSNSTRMWYKVAYVLGYPVWWFMLAGPFRPQRVRLWNSFFSDNIIDHDEVWRTTYDKAEVKFYTPCDKLVAQVWDDGETRVVIDGEEGPAFERIDNVKYLKNENVVSYLGLKRGVFSRITVSV